MENIIIKATVNCDAFIIPNHASKANQYMSQTIAQSIIEFNKNIAELSDLEYDPETDYILQLWLTGEASENFARHGFKVTVDNLEYRFSEYHLEDLSQSFFKDHKEGDIVTLTIPVTPSHAFDTSIEDKELRRKNYIDYMDDAYEPTKEAPLFHITFNIKLNQRDYRYCSFGNFEEVMARVCY